MGVAKHAWVLAWVPKEGVTPSHPHRRLTVVLPKASWPGAEANPGLGWNCQFPILERPVKCDGSVQLHISGHKYGLGSGSRVYGKFPY